MAEEKKVKPVTAATDTEKSAVKKPRKTKADSQTTESPAPVVEAKVDTKPAETSIKETPKVVAAKAQPTDKSTPVAKAKTAPATPLTSRLKEKYVKEIRQTLFTQLKLKSIMQVPRVEKIVVNVGVGDATGNAKLIEESVKELTDITGQKPVITKSKKSIATFKLRENQAIGTKVTLRGIKMYQFLDKLVSVALPRVRDFRGVSRNSFDGRGNYTLGIKEQLIFPEINFDRVNKIRGMDIVIVTTAQNDEQAYALLQALGMPFNR
jgi:large subunit ribosomal protein L5